MPPSPPPDRLLQLGQSFMVAKAFLTAVRLGLFTILAEAPADAGGIRARLGLHGRGLADLLDALVALSVLERDAAGRYANGPEAAAWLVRGGDAYIGGFFEMLDARLYGFWGRLEEGLRTGQPQNEMRDGGAGPFEAIYGDPDRLRGFLQAMTGISLPAARTMATAFPWERVQTFADVGAAQGGCPVALAGAHGHLHGVGFDLPVVQPVFEAWVARHGLADRVRFQAGDFFRDPFPRADVVILGHVLHDWDLPEKRLLLRKAWDAVPEGGAVIVYDAMIDDDRRTNLPGMLISLTMLLETPGGFDYTPAEGMTWLRDAGFRDVGHSVLSAVDAMVFGWK